MVSAIEAELSKATKIKPKKGEARPEYLIRVWDAACDVKDSVWDTLSAPAAEWVNDITLKKREWHAQPNGKTNGKFVPVDFPDVVLESKPLSETLEVAEVEKALEESKKSKAKGPKPEPEEDEDEEEPTKDGSDEIVDEDKEDEQDVLRTKESEPLLTKEPEPKHEPEVEPAKTSPKKSPPQISTMDDEPRLNVQGMVRYMMIEDPHVELDTLHRNIEDQVGETVSLTTVRASRSWFKAALRDLERKDCLSKAFKTKLKLPSA